MSVTKKEMGRLAVVALSVALTVGALGAQEKSDWRKQYPKIAFAPTSSENEADRIVRYKPLLDYMKKTLKVDFDLFVVSDYAGQIEALKAKKIQLASMGADGYAGAYEVTKGNVEPIATMMDSLGSTGYSSVVVVKTESPYQSLADLKGKSFAFADPNSTSGYLFPSFYFRKMGMDPAVFFSKTGFAGSHENDVMAVVNGTYDAAATYMTNEKKGVVLTMISKGMIKEGQVRTIWKSALIPVGPVTILKDLPAQMKQDIQQAFLAFHEVDPEGFKTFTAPGGSMKYVPATHDRYLDIIEMRAELIKLQKK